MNMKHVPYVHLLLFRCKRCDKPLAIPVVCEEGNLEKIDGDIYEVKCNCGWLENLLGVEASRHWVAPWEIAQNPQLLRSGNPRPIGHIESGTS
jgi:hypothetical protein